MRMFAQIFEAFLSKVVEHTADNAINNVKSIKDFKLVLKKLQQNLKSLSAKAYDVEEEIKNTELSGRKKRKREVEEWLEHVKSIEKEVVELGTQVESEGFIMRLMDGGKAAHLIEQVEKLVEQSRNFGEIVLNVCGTRGETLLTNEMIGEAFNENLETILKLLETRQVSSIGVYGMGGVGKTTLAKHIHNRLVQQSQARVFWITVSQEFTIMSLQGKIAHFLGIDLSDEDDEDIRAARLHRALSQMKASVLILDDVWANIDLLKVGCSFSVDNRLIITTRSLEVCRQIRCQKVIRVNKLGVVEVWELFKETLGNEMELDPPVEEIAKSVAKLCDGLPLGIITVAGSMRGEKFIHSWINTLEELKECVAGKDDMGEVDEVFKVLKYSFDRLNRNHYTQINVFNTFQDDMGEVDEVFKVLKYSFDRLNRNHYTQINVFNTFQLCFLYCSLYPEDYEISREDLVGKFISEGLMDQRKSRRAQVHQGHSILDKLVNVCLLESCVDYRGRECVNMHDLVRGMAMKIVEGKYMVRAGNKSLMEIPDEEEWTEGLEKVSLMKSGIRRIGEGISPKCPNLSTLLLCGNHELKVIPDSFFSKMQRLCTLDLRGTDITVLPDSICDMKSLKVLLLESCAMLEKVPYLGKLKALRELNLSYTGIKEVPQGLNELLNLKFLSLDAELEMLPGGLLLKLGHLQHVDFPFDVQAPIEGIENLKLLEEFNGRVKNVNDFNCFIRSGESRVHDTWYTIVVGSCDTNLLKIKRRGTERSYNKELVLFECNLKDEKVLGQDIVCLKIIKCEDLSISFLDNFYNPISLKILVIKKCGGIECILSLSEKGLTSQISTLEYIILKYLDDLKGVVMQRWEIGAAPVPAQPLFSSLRWLTIKNCNKMRRLGLSALGAPNIEGITIEMCGEIEDLFEDEGRDFVTLPKLEWLSLSGLPRLKNVCKATMICNSIVGIFIENCPRLTKKLPLHFDDLLPPTLREMSVEREWWESLEWDDPILPHLLHPFVDFRD